jgi:DNA-binding transcriptional LysR family regulator
MFDVQLETLDAFLAVARYGSITGAAQALGFTQSAVSRQVATLEAQTGTRLFDRLARGVTLTDEGRCLLPHAEAMVSRLATARRDLDALRGLGAGRLRVGAFPTALAALVPRALAAFRSANPRHQPGAGRGAHARAAGAPAVRRRRRGGGQRAARPAA